MSAPTSDELQLIHIFRSRILTTLYVQIEEGQSSDQNLLRWIRARELDLDKAEEMLKRHLQWRKRNGIGESLLDWTPSKFLRETYAAQFIGFDPSGSPILLLNFGQWDIRPALEKGEKEALIRFKDQVLEQVMRLMKIYEAWAKKSKKNFHDVTQFISLGDWQGFSLRYIMNKEAVEVILEVAKSFEANYPETLKAGFNINCPKVFTVLFNLVKPFLSERTLSKIFIYDSNASKWKPELLKTIPLASLPAKYGGPKTKTWPLAELNLTLEEEDETLELILNESAADAASQEVKGNFGGFGNMKPIVVRVAPGYKLNIPNYVNSVGSRISWHFTVEEKDIGFAILYENPNSVSDEVVNYQRVSEDLGSIICEKAGNYILSFDNIFSTFKAKVISYKLTIDNPFSVD